MFENNIVNKILLAHSYSRRLLFYDVEDSVLLYYMVEILNNVEKPIFEIFKLVTLENNFDVQINLDCNNNLQNLEKGYDVNKLIVNLLILNDLLIILDKNIDLIEKLPKINQDKFKDQLNTTKRRIENIKVFLQKKDIKIESNLNIVKRRRIPINLHE